MAAVGISGVRKSFGGTDVIRGIDIDIDDGSFVVLVGPSGCGKSTLLRMVAGLEDVTAGEIRIGGRVVNDLPPRDRDIAMVFQSYALYPHMKVRDNMAFGLKLRKISRTEIRDRVGRAAKILGLNEHLDRYPRHLSGGQRQRVAMGRAIVRDPQVFLPDLPGGHHRLADAPDDPPQLRHRGEFLAHGICRPAKLHRSVLPAIDCSSI